MKSRASSILEAFGMGIGAYAAWRLHPEAGLFAAAFVLIVIGLAVDK